MAKNQLTVFDVGNGDTILLEAHGKTILTDIHYRAASADENDDTNDIGPTIREACSNDSLDLFVLTHPDEDHLRGFGELFHLGNPDTRDKDPDEGEVLLLANEIWCSEYAVNPNYSTDVSKPLLDEIKRRHKLIGTLEGRKDGNRLKVKTATDAAEYTLFHNIDYRILAPTADEANIPKTDEGQANNSSNPSSLVIQWGITVGGKTSHVMLAGDSDVEVWERIEDNYNPEIKKWHILVCPHHCSRSVMGRKFIRDGKEVFEWSDTAIAGLDHPIGTSPHVVSSSKKFGGATPPNPLARDRYYSILAIDGEVTEGVRDRFRVTGGKHGDDPEDVTFRFTSQGPTRSFAIAAISSSSNPASTDGGGYG